jgi:competence ComEA-like helix-hairpin-helix protein
LAYNLATVHRTAPVRLFLVFFLFSLVFPTTVLFAKKKPPAKPVNINLATAAELEQVPGIGPATAEKILQMRKSYGAFKSVDDLLAVRGIGRKRLDKMRKYLVAGKAGPPKQLEKAPPEKSSGAPKQ